MVEERRVRRKRQRGATLTSYAVALTTMVVAALSSLELLVTNSEEFLIDSGSSIGEPLPDRNIEFDPALVAPDGWERTEPGAGDPDPNAPPPPPPPPPPPDPDPDPTPDPDPDPDPTPDPTPEPTPDPVFADQVVGTHAPGMCLGLTNGTLQQLDCGTAGIQPVTAQPLAGGGTELRLTSGACLGLPGSTADASVVVEMPCGTPGSTWALSPTTPYELQNLRANADRNQAMCMDVFGASTTSGSDIIIWPCHNGTNQRFPLS